VTHLTGRSIVVDHLEDRLYTQNTGIAYIYFDSQDQEHQTAPNVFSSLLKQLAVCSKETSPTVTNMYSRHDARGTRPDSTELVACIVSICRLFSATFIILDALDEAENNCRREVLKELSRVLESKGVKVLASGRPYIASIESFGFSSTIQVRADIRDLTAFLEIKLMETTLESTELKKKIVDVLSTKANGL
jgi:hypothetical protein